MEHGGGDEEEDGGVYEQVAKQVQGGGGGDRRVGVALLVAHEGNNGEAEQSDGAEVIFMHQLVQVSTVRDGFWVGEANTDRFAFHFAEECFCVA